MELCLSFGLALALLSCFLVDIVSRRIPNWLTASLTVAGVAVSAYTGLEAAMWSCIGAAAGFLSLYLISISYLHFRHQHGLGLGDAKLLAAAGAWLGPLYLAPVVFLSAVLALAFALGLRLVGRSISWQTTLPFGPFLSAGFFICWCARLGGWTLEV